MDGQISRYISGYEFVLSISSVMHNTADIVRAQAGMQLRMKLRGIGLVLSQGWQHRMEGYIDSRRYLCTGSKRRRIDSPLQADEPNSRDGNRLLHSMLPWRCVVLLKAELHARTDDFEGCQSDERTEAKASR